MALNSVIGRFKTGTYVVTRAGAGSYVAGVWTPAATSALNVDANVQPLGYKEIQLLSEGTHASDSLKMYTTTELRTADEAAGTEADLIAIGSESYKVISVQSWKRSKSGGDYYKAILGKVV